jgi:hypothetical protein
MRKPLTALVCLAGLLAASPALAAPKLGDFAMADTNHDGQISLQEFESYETQRLMQAHGMLAQHFQKLSPQQQQAALQKRFNKLDSGAKGYLNQNDWNRT